MMAPATTARKTQIMVSLSLCLRDERVSNRPAHRINGDAAYYTVFHQICRGGSEPQTQATGLAVLPDRIIRRYTIVAASAES